MGELLFSEYESLRIVKNSAHFVLAGLSFLKRCYNDLHKHWSGRAVELFGQSEDSDWTACT